MAQSEDYLVPTTHPTEPNRQYRVKTNDTGQVEITETTGYGLSNETTIVDNPQAYFAKHGRTIVIDKITPYRCTKEAVFH